MHRHGGRVRKSQRVTEHDVAQFDVAVADGFARGRVTEFDETGRRKERQTEDPVIGEKRRRRDAELRLERWQRSGNTPTKHRMMPARCTGTRTPFE